MPWNKGFSKNDHPSVMKISQTMRAKHLDNFKKWRDQMRELGIIPQDYAPFKGSSDLAELIGVILGDGHIQKFPRTERLLIFSNSNNPGFVKHYGALVKNFFHKKPTISKVTNVNMMRISLYQKEISKRLGIPTGNRGSLEIIIPSWIWKERACIVGLLKGLFEAEGSLSIHMPTYTYNFQFSNKNRSLLDTVEKGLRLLGYHPEIRKIYIRLRRKTEVVLFKDQIKFREYNIIAG